MQALIQSTTLRKAYSSLRGSHDMSCDQRWERVREDVSEDEFEVDISGSPEPSLVAAVKVNWQNNRDTIYTITDCCSC